MRRRSKHGRPGVWLCVTRSEIDMVRAGLWEVPPDFRCRKPEFAEYLDINAAYDQQQWMGQLYWAMHNGETVGYMMLAMGHAVKTRQADLGIDTYGNIPALVIARLATDERYERQGVGRYMTSYAIDIAGKLALDAGCRLILANSAPDAVGFYKKMGFGKFTARPPSGRDKPGHESFQHTDAEAGVGEGLVQMYLDVGVRGSERVTGR